MAITGTLLAFELNNQFSTEIPGRGGTYHEAIVGTPRFINPVLALTDADRDITMLVYSGLLRATKEGGYIPDLAERVDISPDGKTYTVTLKKNLTFHDGNPLSARDVLFTISSLKDPLIKSPKRANWEGVEVEARDDSTLVFTLRQAYAPFLDNLTVGILPQHLWESVEPAEFPFSTLNINAIGSGPYMIKKVDRNEGGLPSSFILTPHTNFSLGRPYIETLILSVYQNEVRAIEALLQGDSEAVGGISPEAGRALSSRGEHIHAYTLPRVFGVFFNQNKNMVFTDTSVRRALALVAPREQVVEQVLFGFGLPLRGPLQEALEQRPLEERVQEATLLMNKAGWVKATSTGIFEKRNKKETTTLRFTIATADTPELKRSAELVKDAWRAFGADVTVSIYETGDLQERVIRERTYDALLFGTVVGRDKDLYPFWHSSQRNDPSLNVAMYVNKTADRLLDSARKTSDTSQRDETLNTLLLEFDKDAPAAFLYAPEYVSVLPKGVERVGSGEIVHASERFLDIYQWYREKDKVWNIFLKNHEE